MVQLTVRDGEMLAWLSRVRFANLDAAAWALGALGERTGPVGVRRAQRWMKRLTDVGLIQHVQPTFADGSILWAIPESGGKRPDPYRQTVRHEVAVAEVSARYLAQGWHWSTDRTPTSRGDHQADGLATRDSERVLVEVELTQKSHRRYRQIFTNHTWRLERENITGIAYYGTTDVIHAVTREADTLMPAGLRNRILLSAALDVRGRWCSKWNRLATKPAGQAETRQPRR